MGNAEPTILSGMIMKPEFIATELDAQSDVDAIKLLANKLLENGIVKESFIPAIIKREQEFCTGLQFEDMGIAIPHTDAEHVNQAAITIGILKNPVEFKSMGMPEIPVNAEILFMMAINKPHAQLEFLRELMTMLQTEGRLRELKACKTQEEVVSKFYSFFE